MSDPTHALKGGRILILDGATGTELERRGVPMDDVAWCGAANLKHGETLCAVHADYIRAGADIVTTNTFASGRQPLEAAGLGDRVHEVNRAAVVAAQAARDQAAGGREIWIAGSVSPLAPAADPSRRPPLEVAAAAFQEQAAILAEAGVDLILLEMMRDVHYTRAAVAAGRATGLPVWAGFSCVRGPNGAMVTVPGITTDLPLTDAVQGADGASLMAIMHTAIEDTPDALKALGDVFDGPIGAYPHAGSFVMPHWQFEDVAPEAYLRAAEDWVALGAQVVGGCCGIGPEHIRLLAERLPRRAGGCTPPRS